MSSLPDTALVRLVAQPIGVNGPPESFWQSNFVAGVVGAVIGGVIALMAQAAFLRRERDERTKFDLSLLQHAYVRRRGTINVAAPLVKQFPFAATNILQPLVLFELDSARYDEALARLDDFELASGIRDWLTNTSRAILAADAGVRVRVATWGDRPIEDTFIADIGGMADHLATFGANDEKLERGLALAYKTVCERLKRWL